VRFLLLSDVLEVMYGGAAGGGKSDALLMAAAQYVDVPGYSAIILRENFPDLNQPDALIPRSKAWWTGKAHWSERDRRWTFPSGATITFGYLECDNDVYQYQGAAFQFVGIDELTQHTEFRYRYMFSRIRRPESGALASVPLRMRSGTNPGGKGHSWVFGRFIDERSRVSGAVFVPAQLTDNPSIDAEEYEKSLDHLDPITRAQLLRGDWDAIAGGRFRAEWFTRRFQRRGTHYLIGDRVYEVDRVMRFGTCDPAASALETAKSADPDYTVVSAWGITPQPELLWLDCVRVRKEIPDLVPVIQSVYDRWEMQYVGIEAVAANRAVLQLARRTRMNVKELSPLGQDKLVRATAAMVLAESRRVYLPEHAPWIEDALAEVTRFTGNDKQDAHDDVVDTLSYAAKLFTVNEQQKAGGFAPYFSGGRR
jgi:predicted phage terminase large subunit-like protein